MRICHHVCDLVARSLGQWCRCARASRLHGFNGTRGGRGQGNNFALHRQVLYSPVTSTFRDLQSNARQVTSTCKLSHNWFGGRTASWLSWMARELCSFSIMHSTGQYRAWAPSGWTERYRFTNIASLSSIPATFLEREFDFWTAYLMATASLVLSLTVLIGLKSKLGNTSQPFPQSLFCC